MASDLLDVNVWLALALPAHSHQAAAKAYWLGAKTLLAFCRASMQGFLRLVAQPVVIGGNGAYARRGLGHLQRPPSRWPCAVFG